MNLISKVCAIIVLLCIGGILYVSYKFVKIMEVVDILYPGKIIKEMISFSVFIILFGMIISTTVKIIIKQREYAQEEKKSALTPRF